MKSGWSKTYSNTNLLNIGFPFIWLMIFPYAAKSILLIYSSWDLIPKLHKLITSSIIYSSISLKLHKCSIKT